MTDYEKGQRDLIKHINTTLVDISKVKGTTFEDVIVFLQTLKPLKP